MADRVFRPTERYTQIVEEIREAISLGIQPTLITQGSSGSYFCRNKANEVVGVFKPKDEEPYGELNPKYGKWVQRNLFPCCFGRSCLIPNQGYLSEAAASVVARALGLSVVPETAVVRLRSPSFNHSYLRREMDRKLVSQLPEKIGSLQTFVHGYTDAYLALRDLQGRASPAALTDLQRQFQEMVVIDYIIRNTDRGLQNWLIRWEQDADKDVDAQRLPGFGGVDAPPGPTGATLQSKDFAMKPPEGLSNPGSPLVRVAAIDNGLAFPFKHPDNWRSYPFAWADLPLARVPFAGDFAADILEKISCRDFRDRLIADLRVAMQIDKRYSSLLFGQQMAVMVGQMYNLAEVLRDGGCPADLPNKSPVTVNMHPERGLMLSIYRNRPCFSRC